MKKLISLLLALVLLVGVLAGCAPAEKAGNDTQKSEPQKEEKKEETQKKEEPSGTEDEDCLLMPATYMFNPTQTGYRCPHYYGGQNGENLVMESLMAYDVAKGEYVTQLADKVDVSDDGLTYTVTLKDATFHDGTKCTASDVAFSYCIRAKVGGGDLLSGLEGYDAFMDGSADTIKGIEAVDEKTVVFHLTGIDATMNRLLATSQASVVPASYFKDVAWEDIVNDSFWEHPIGTGPFYVDETNYPEYVIVRRYDDYHSEPAGVGKIIFKYYTDYEAWSSALIAGDVYYSRDHAYEDAMNIAAQNPDVKVELADSIYTRYMVINSTGKSSPTFTPHPGMTNPRVRQALNLLIDKEAICSFFGDSATPLTSMINPNMPDYNTDIPLFQRNVEEAKKILEEENFDFDTPLTLCAYYTDQVTADIMDVIVQNLSDGGVQATYFIDSNTYGKNDDGTLQYDMQYCAISATFSTDIYSAYTSSASQCFNDADAANYKARYNDLVAAWRGTLDAAKQKEALDQIQVNGMEDMQTIPLYSCSSVTVLNTRHFEGFPVHPTDYMSMFDHRAEDWKYIP